MTDTRNTSRARAAKQTRGNGAGDLGDQPGTEIVTPDAEAGAQAEFEGVDAPLYVTFSGDRFRLARKVSYLPLLKFAHYANKGTDSASMQGMAAMYEMLRACFDRGQPCGECAICLGDDQADPPVAPSPRDCEQRVGDEWPRFEERAIDDAADDEDLFGVVSEVIELVSARPTRQRSGYTRPAPRTSARSKAASRLPPGAEDMLNVNDLAR